MHKIVGPAATTICYLFCTTYVSSPLVTYTTSYTSTATSTTTAPPPPTTAATTTSNLGKAKGGSFQKRGSL